MKIYAGYGRWAVETPAHCELGGGTAMRYSLTPPLALEADYLAASAHVDLPFNPVCFEL